MKVGKNNLSKIIKIGSIVAITFLTLKFLLPIVNSDEFRDFTISLGPLGPLVIILYTIVSHIFIPVVGTPVVLLSITLFGTTKTLFYLYIASLISAIVNFYISRRLGRKWVEKLADKDNMEQIDDFVKAEGKEVLILSRLFGFSIFEIISYAAGLTNINFKDYFVITVICSAVPNIFFAIVLRDLNFASTNLLLIWLGSLIVAGGCFVVLIKNYLRNRGKLKYPQN